MMTPWADHYNSSGGKQIKKKNKINAARRKDMVAK